MNICINCKYHIYKRGNRCTHPDIPKVIDEVTGEVNHIYCIVLRLEHRECKSEGILFERTEIGVFKKLWKKFTS